MAKTEPLSFFVKLDGPSGPMCRVRIENAVFLYILEPPNVWHKYQDRIENVGFYAHPRSMFPSPNILHKFQNRIKNVPDDLKESLLYLKNEVDLVYPKATSIEFLELDNIFNNCLYNIVGYIRFFLCYICIQSFI